MIKIYYMQQVIVKIEVQSNKSRTRMIVQREGRALAMLKNSLSLVPGTPYRSLISTISDI